MTTAFVLSGGGSLGAVQVGMLQALSDRGVRPDVLIGTSAGAINAAYVAGHGNGGVANNTAVSQAVALGADEVYVLPAGFACALDRAPATALGAAVQAITLLIEQRLVIDVARYAEQTDIKVLPPLCPLSVSATDF